ncbi:hypothetical protein [Planktothrix agardhii]|uniref:hypothetical protein n=1 Tax=Planktothrix agardhii TaxID=1160 RepID=UPI0003F5E478|nr:hypothetical protein [Planktothrix agardhii]
MTDANWNRILDSIPDEASEAIVSDYFVKPLLKALGFSIEEQYPEFKTGSGTVDFASRKNQISINAEPGDEGTRDEPTKY